VRKYILSTAAIVLMLGLFLQGLPSSAQEPQLQEAPKLAVTAKSPPIINGYGTGFIPPPMDLSHLTGQTTFSEGASVGTVLQPPASFDWRTQGKVTPVGDQGDCGSCYAFASIGNIESKLLLDGAGTYDFSENNAKECNWYDTSCGGGAYFKIANLFSKKGTVLETCDPYVDSDVSCKGTCPYQKTLLDWRIICGNVVPATNVLKTYIQTYGPVYTAMYSGLPGFDTYDGSYTLYYTGTEYTDHAVLIVGWNDSLVHAGGSGGWIVKNSWGTEWGGTCGYGTERGYFTIAYGSASIGMYSSFIYDWQTYDSSGGIMYYDEAGWATSYGELGGGNLTAWGLCRFIPLSDTYVTRVEFWTTDITTDIDVYIYDDFDGTNLNNLLAQKLNTSFSQAGYHSVALDSSLPVTAGDDVIAVVKFTNSSFGYPVAADHMNPVHETGRTYISLTGTSGSWTGMGSDFGVDVAIRLRTSTLVQIPPSVTTNDATSATSTSATLNGNLSSKGTALTVYASFEYGPTTAYGQETTPQAMTTTGPFSFNLSGLSPDTLCHFRAKAVGDGTSYGSDKSFTTLPPEVPPTTSATRTLPASVDPGANFDVGIVASGCDLMGDVAETLPAGFSYVGTTSDNVFVTQVGNLVRFSFMGDGVSFDYTVTASTTEGPHTFSGVVKDEYLNEYTIGGDSTITVSVFNPWDYDLDENGVISKMEALTAVVDYFGGLITKQQALAVIVLYFAT